MLHRRTTWDVSGLMISDCIKATVWPSVNAEAGCDNCRYHSIDAAANPEPGVAKINFDHIQDAVWSSVNAEAGCDNRRYIQLCSVIVSFIATCQPVERFLRASLMSSTIAVMILALLQFSIIRKNLHCVIFALGELLLRQFADASYPYVCYLAACG